MQSMQCRRFFVDRKRTWPVAPQRLLFAGIQQDEELPCSLRHSERRFHALFAPVFTRCHGWLFPVNGFVRSLFDLRSHARAATADRNGRPSRSVLSAGSEFKFTEFWTAECVHVGSAKRCCCRSTRGSVRSCGCCRNWRCNARIRTNLRSAAECQPAMAGTCFQSLHGSQWAEWGSRSFGSSY